MLKNVTIVIHHSPEITIQRQKDKNVRFRKKKTTVKMHRPAIVSEETQKPNISLPS